MNQFHYYGIETKNTSYALILFVLYSKPKEKDFPNIYLINFDYYNPTKTTKPIMKYRSQEEDTREGEGKIEVY